MTDHGGAPLRQRAERLADDVLFPAAMEVDRADRLPASHLDALAARGFYGMAAPPELGGSGLDLGEACEVIATLSSGCLTTTFVWLQHQGVLRRLAGGPGALRDEYLDRLVRGELRAGVALGGCVPGPPLLQATAVGGGWRLDGVSPWLTGWGMIDLVNVAARTEADELIYLLVDAHESSTFTVERQTMVAANASRTMKATFDGHVVADQRVVGTQPFAEFRAHDGYGLGLNGFLALGVVDRTLRLLGPSPLDDRAAAVREALAVPDPEALPAARAEIAALALQATSALVVAVGSGSILVDQHAQRLAREAMFVAVFGSRPAIKDALLHRLRG